jgi:hypothetical protein
MVEIFNINTKNLIFSTRLSFKKKKKKEVPDKLLRSKQREGEKKIPKGEGNKINYA